MRARLGGLWHDAIIRVGLVPSTLAGWTFEKDRRLSPMHPPVLVECSPILVAPACWMDQFVLHYASQLRSQSACLGGAELFRIDDDDPRCLDSAELLHAW